MYTAVDYRYAQAAAMIAKPWLSIIIVAIGAIAVAQSQTLSRQRAHPPLTEALPFDRLFTFADERQALDNARNNPPPPPTAEPTLASVAPALERSPPQQTALERSPPQQTEAKTLAAVIAPQSQSQSTAATVVINGLVLRADGHHTVWLNGTTIIPGQPNAYGLTVAVDGIGPRLYLQRHPDQAKVEVKPGQYFDSTLGTVQESYAPNFR